MYDVYKIRNDFPIFGTMQNGKPLVFLDTAASAQKPQIMLDEINKVYTSSYANPHRGTYTLADEITRHFEQARQTVAAFVNACCAKEIIFTRNATESINLIASSWGDINLKADDEVLISDAEHHANLVPWQNICKKNGAKLKHFPISDNGDFLEEEFISYLNKKTKIVAVTAMSNVLGTIFPIQKICHLAHQAGAKVLIDACQFAVHNQIDVQSIDCDFLVFSGHKTYGPTGIGILYGKQEILEQMPPYQFGGDMIDKVTFAKTVFADIPARFEAGTQASVQAIGLAASLRYMQNLGLENIATHEQTLCNYALKQLKSIPQLKLVGNATNRGGVFSFALHNIHPQDAAFVLNKENIAVRIGHHCAEPLVERMGYKSLIRASLGLYSTKEDIDALIAAIHKTIHFFKED